MKTNSLTIAAEEMSETYRCPGCDRPVDTDEWPIDYSAGDAWGGQARHSCPTDGCDGTITVLF